MKYKLEDTVFYNVHEQKLMPYSMVPLIVLARGQMEFKDGMKNVYMVRFRFNNRWMETLLPEAVLSYVNPFGPRR